MHLLKLIVSLVLLCSIFFFIIKQSQQPVYHANHTPPQNLTKREAQLRILILCRNSGIGGGEIHAINLYKELINKGIQTSFLTPHNPEFANYFIQHNLPFYTYDPFNISLVSKKFLEYEFSYQPCFENAILEICKKEKISIIHCNNIRELFAAQKIAQKIPVKICYTHQSYKPIPLKLLKIIDGFIGINDTHLQSIKPLPKAKACIQPFFNEKKFLNFSPPSLSRQDFFKQTFGVNVKNELPLACLIAYFYDDKRKNHELLLQAAQKLIFEKKKFFQIAFAGSGPCEKYYQDLAHRYGLDNYVYFLGSTQKTPDLLFYSDINILPSKEEAFGIVAAEGALMKKPTIVSHVVGAANSIIFHEKTGLIFENDNVESLITMLETLLDNPRLGKELGEKAYSHVFAHYSNQAKLKKLLSFYNEVLKNS